MNDNTPLPKPNVYSPARGVTGNAQWSYSEDLLRVYVAQAVAQERERNILICRAMAAQSRNIVAAEHYEECADAIKRGSA